VRLRVRHPHGVTRQTSDGDFEARVFNATRRLWTSDEASQPSRTFESPRARRDAPNKRRSMLKRRVRIHERHPHGVTRQRATETSKHAFSMRHGGFGRWMRSRNRRARSNRRARAESRKTSGRYWRAENAWETNQKKVIWTCTRSAPGSSYYLRS